MILWYNVHINTIYSRKWCCMSFIRKILSAFIFVSVIGVMLVAFTSCSEKEIEMYDILEMTILKDLIEDISQYDLSVTAKRTLDEIIALYNSESVSDFDISAAIVSLSKVKNEILLQPVNFIDGAAEMMVKKALGLPSNG